MQRTFLSKRTMGLAAIVALTAGLAVAAPASASAATINVCPSGCTYSQIGPAVAAAKSGDTIRIGAGTYRGGINITVSVRLLGAGVDRTTIKGGGPVLTIGTFGGATQPTVVIDGVTVTGGVTHDSELSDVWVGEPNVIALGGGIEIPPNADFSGGATVTISHSLITGNRAAPTATVGSGLPCPDGECPFGVARGGGIDSWGALTLNDTTVSDNVATGLASDVDGGGVMVWDTGSLAVVHSRITGNRAIAGVPAGRFAEGGGIFTDPGIDVTIKDSVVDDNVASLTSNLPFFVDGADPLDMNANGGGIHIGDGSTVVITDSFFRGNRATVSDPNGEPVAFDSAVHAGDGHLVLRRTTISGNRVAADVATTEHVGPSGSALDVAGTATISNVSITDNTTVVTSPSGEAGASGGGLYSLGGGPDAIVISDSVIRGNTTIASSTTGSAYVLGAAAVNDGRLVLVDDVIANNVGIVRAPTGAALGGGIWSGSLFNQPPIELTLKGTTIRGNSLRGTPGIRLEGGGLYTTFPVTIQRSVIAGNAPDNCVGCASGSSAPHRTAASGGRAWSVVRGSAPRGGAWLARPGVIEGR